MSETDPQKIFAPFGKNRHDAGSAERVKGVFEYLKSNWGVKFSEFSMAHAEHTWTVRCMSVLSVGETVFLERDTERGSERFAVTQDWPKFTVRGEAGQKRGLASEEERTLLHEILDEIVVRDLAPMPRPELLDGKS